MEELFKNIEYVRVKNRPIAVPYNYRITYKVTQLLLIINNCCKPRKGCSLEKIQIISDAISSEKSLDKLKYFLDDSDNFITIRFDPAVNRAISYAMGEDLLAMQNNGLFKLTRKGKEYVKLINSSDICKEEKSIMSEISDVLTEERIKALMSDWRFKHAED